MGKLGEQHHLVGLIELEVVLEALNCCLMDLPRSLLASKWVLSKCLLILREIRLEFLSMRVWIVLALHVYS